MAPLLAVLLMARCADRESGPAVLTADLPLHLEDHLDAATIESSEVPKDIPEAVEWRFDEPQPDWKPAYGYEFSQELVTLVRTGDALRVILEEKHADSDGDICGYVYTDVPEWQLQEWAYVALEARVQPGMEGVGLAFNFTEPARAGIRQARGPTSPLIADGTVQTYLLSPDPAGGEFDGTWRQLIFQFCAFKPSTLDLLSVKAIPKEAAFASAPVGVSTETLNGESRRTLYGHAPGKLAYRVRIPEAAQLDVGLRVVRPDVPVTFRVTATPAGGEPETLHEETFADTKHWAQRRVDLSHLAGQDVTLALEVDADRGGTVALWGAPTLTGAPASEKPNIIFYVIDGAGADLMSLYGYNRRTTPNLERIATEGAVFDYAYSNSTWTTPSTLSFLTSLQHSVLGGLRNGRNMAPEEVLTIAQHLRRAGYQTAFFTSNPNAGRMSGLERGIDVLREAGVGNSSASSVELHAGFWRWREAYPAEPYWVRFQTTDVHGPNVPEPPFAGMYVSPEQQATFRNDWQPRLEEAGGDFPHSEAFEKTGVDRQSFFDVARGLYDETMAHQDYQIGRFVERLKATGDWENTLLIVAADHGHIAGSRHFGVGLADPMPATWEVAMASSYHTRVPLVIVWPARIRGGQRFDEPVSMIDVLPTVLDLAGLPMPDVMQGQSLTPLLLEQEGWEPRPVILDEFELDQETDQLRGTIEVIDGRWAASLFIDPRPDALRIPLRGHHDGVGAKEAAWNQRPQSVPRLLLYDLWSDPRAFYSVHEEHPDLVEKYTAFLEAQWRAHQALAQQFTRSEDSPMTPEQMRALRALGYVQ
jgi:arylsulfatase A-like enzyme